MSLDVFVSDSYCDRCGRYGERLGEVNMTYNLSRMIGTAAKAVEAATEMDLAGIDSPVVDVIFGKYKMLDGIEGRAGDAAPKLRKIVDELRAHPDKYKPLEPSNGWGTYSSCVESLGELLTMLEENPDAVVSTSR
jgi:hypothetical protein